MYTSSSSPASPARVCPLATAFLLGPSAPLLLALPAAVLVAVNAPALPTLQMDDASESKTQGRPDDLVEAVEKVSVDEGRMSEAEAKAARGEGATTEERGEVEVARG